MPTTKQPAVQHAKRPHPTKKGPGRYHSEQPHGAAPKPSKGAPFGHQQHTASAEKLQRRAAVAAVGRRQAVRARRAKQLDMFAGEVAA